MDVRLEQLVGQRAGRNGIQEIAHAVDRVFFNDKHVGWLGRHTGATLIFLPGVAEANKEDIRKQVSAIREEEGIYPGVKQETVQPVHVPAAVIEEEEEDDE